MKTQTLFEASAPAPVRPSSVSKAVTDKMAKLGEFRVLTLRETPAFGKAENPEHSADYEATTSSGVQLLTERCNQANNAQQIPTSLNHAQHL